VPFGHDCEYPDFDACLAANQDKDDPEAYCGALMRDTEEMCRNRSGQGARNLSQDKLEFVSVKEFKERHQEGKGTFVGVRKGFSLEEAKRIDDGEDGLLLEMTISTADQDRDGDTISVRGWELEDYKKNPVVLWAHSHGDPPVGKSTRIWISNEKLRSQTRFTPHDLNPFGHMVGRLYEEGYMRATSVGFLPLEWEEARERAGDGPWFMPMDFKRQSLLEYSTVPVPSNPHALADAKAKGVVDLSPMVDWAEKVLDEAGEGEKGLWVPRKTVESIYSLLAKDVTVSVPNSTSDKDQDEVDPEVLESEDETGEKASGEAVETVEVPDEGESGSREEAVSEESGSLDVEESRSVGVGARWKVMLEGNGQGSVEVDGQPLKGVRAVEVRGAVDLVPSLVIEVIPSELEVEGEGDFGFEKRGRVLSGANENRLARARDLIDEVLKSVQSDSDDEDEDRSVENGVSREKGGTESDSDDEIIEFALDEPEDEPSDELSVDAEELAEIVARAVEENINRIRGRVD
jgi:hypothetical protein